MKKQWWVCAGIGAIMALPAIGPAQSTAGHESSAAGTATASCRSAASWEGAFDFVRQSLSTVDITTVRATELIALNQRIAGAVRSTLGVSDTLLPRADTLDDAEDDGALPLAIVLHRDAPATWHAESAPATDDARFVRLYTLVLSTMAPNDLRISWPTGATHDSAEVRVRVSTQVFGGLGSDQPSRNAVVIFKALHPIDSNGPPVLARSGPFFPSHHVMTGGVAVRVVMEATIDADGNVEKKSVHDIRSLASESDSAHFADYYKNVVDAARQAMLHSKYVPAHRGGCAVGQTIRQSFSVNPGALR